MKKNVKFKKKADAARFEEPMFPSKVKGKGTGKKKTKMGFKKS